MTLYVDTSTWYAALDRDDRDHEAAARVLGSGETLLLSDHVLVETWRLAHHRLGRDAAEQFWGGVRRGMARLEPVGAGDLEAAWRIGTTYPDQDFSLPDRTSFAVMERLRISRVASLDDDFLVYRGGAHRDRAFTVIR